MTLFLFSLAIILSVAGIAGCIIPGLPGAPLNYLALWCLQWAFAPFSSSTMISLAIVTVVIILADYFIPVWTAKRFGATRQGIIGSMLGMVIGFFLTPIGMILGIMAGAIIGDMIAGRTHTQATRSGIATFLGTLLTIGIKLLFSGILTMVVIYKVIAYVVG